MKSYFTNWYEIVESTDDRGREITLRYTTGDQCTDEDPILEQAIEAIGNRKCKAIGIVLNEMIGVGKKAKTKKVLWAKYVQDAHGGWNEKKGK